MTTGCTGNLDLTASTKVIGVAAPTACSARPPRVPFAADADDAGRLVHYTPDTPNGDSGTNKVAIAFSEFGVPVAVQAVAPCRVGTTPSR